MISKEHIETAKLQIKQYVDGYGLKLIAELLAEIAMDKSVHIAENWQDMALAKLWTKRSEQLTATISKWEDDL